MSMNQNACFPNSAGGKRSSVSTQLLATTSATSSRRNSRDEICRNPTRKIMSELCFTSEELSMYLYGRYDVLPVTDDAYCTESRQLQTEGASNSSDSLTRSVDILQLRYKQGVEKEFCSTDEFNKVLRLIKGIPSKLQLCYSGVPGAGFGVCAKETIVNGTCIGPYLGKLVSEEDVKTVADTKYVWEIYKNGKTDHFIDGSDSADSTWMKYIQCARNTAEQNMVVFQFGVDIYFQCYKDIHVGEELLIWYADYYDQYLGIPVGLINFTKEKDSGEKAPINKDVPPIPSLRMTSEINQSKMPAIFLEDPNPSSRELFPAPSLSPSSSNHVTSGQVLTPPYTSSAIRNHILPPKVTKAVPMTTYKHDETSVIERHISQNGKPLQTRFWKCSNCLGDFPQKWALQVHECPCDITQSFNCNQCNQVFIEKGDLQMHIKNCCSGLAYKCGYCRRSFTQLSNLTNHMKLHPRQRLVTGRRRRGRISNYEKLILQKQLQI